jgi:hypothetical protein
MLNLWILPRISELIEFVVTPHLTHILQLRNYFSICFRKIYEVEINIKQD